MGKLGMWLVVTAGVAVGGAVALAYKISQETGKTFVEAASEVPAEATRYWEDLRARAMDAVQSGRTAAQKKEEEIQKRLSGQI
jgi:hypothetical protein